MSHSRRLPGHLFSLAVVAAVFCSVPAFAESPEVQRYLFAASQLYENLDYERALEQVQRAKARASSMEDDVHVALWEGVIQADLGRLDESKAAFRTALLLDPEAKVPVRVSPKVAKDFEALRADVKKELAPMLARQKAEREAEAKRVEQERATADANRAEQRATAEAKRREQERESIARSEQIHPDREGTAAVSPPAYLPSAEKAVAPPGRSWVLPSVFGGVAVAATGVGTIFGLAARRQVEAAQNAGFQSEALTSLRQAEQSALVANLLFATAGTAALGGVTALLFGGPPAPAPSTAAGGAR